MNPEHEPAGGPETARSRLHPALAAAMQAEAARSPEPVTVEAAEVERSMLAVHRDPTLTAGEPEAETPAREAVAEEKHRTQVRWVRPTELAMQGGARATGWGIDLRTELAQRLANARTGHMQHHPEPRTHERGERASRLPDLSISGRGRRAERREPVRSGTGLR